MTQATIYEILSPKTPERARELLLASNIIVDPQKLIERNQNMQNIISNVLITLKIPPQILNLKSSQINGIKDESELKEFNMKLKIASLISAYYTMSLIEDALKIFMKEEEAKKNILLLHDYIARLSTENDVRKIANYEAQRQQLAAQMQFIIAMAEYDRWHNEAMIQFDACFKRHTELQARINQIDREMEASLNAYVKEHGQFLANSIKNSNNPQVIELFKNQDPKKVDDLCEAIAREQIPYEINKQKLQGKIAVVKSEYDGNHRPFSPIMGFKKKGDFENDPRVIKYNTKLIVNDTEHEKMIRSELDKRGIKSKPELVGPLVKEIKSNNKKNPENQVFIKKRIELGKEKKSLIAKAEVETDKMKEILQQAETRLQDRNEVLKNAPPAQAAQVTEQTQQYKKERDERTAILNSLGSTDAPKPSRRNNK